MSTTDSSTPNKKQLYKVGATVWAKVTLVLKPGDRGRIFGNLANKTWIPGIVQHLYTKTSKRCREVKYAKICFYCGGNDIRQRDMSFSVVTVKPHIKDPNLPFDLSSFIADGGCMYSDMDDVSSITADPTLTSPVLHRTATANPSIVSPMPTTPAPTTLPTDVASPTPMTTPTIECHGTTWNADDGIVCSLDCNGPFADNSWSMKDSERNIFSNGCDVGKKMSRFDYFMICYPPSQLRAELAATNEQLESAGLKPIDPWQSLWNVSQVY
jgi:hypothetical protein